MEETLWTQQISEQTCQLYLHFIFSDLPLKALKRYDLHSCSFPPCSIPGGNLPNTRLKIHLRQQTQTLLMISCRQHLPISSRVWKFHPLFLHHAVSIHLLMQPAPSRTVFTHVITLTASERRRGEDDGGFCERWETRLERWKLCLASTARAATADNRTCKPFTCSCRWSLLSFLASSSNRKFTWRWWGEEMCLPTNQLLFTECKVPKLWTYVCYCLPKTAILQKLYSCSRNMKQKMHLGQNMRPFCL